MLTTAELVDAWGLNILLYGHSGVGKTYLAGTAADDDRTRPVLVIDAEGGSRTLVGKDHVVVVKPERFKDVTDLYIWLRDTDPLPYKTVVLDSITEIQALGLRDILLTAKDPSFPGLQDYGRSNEQITRLVRRFRDLAHTRGLNVIFTALAREDRDEATGFILTRPALTPKAAEGICGAVDTVAYLDLDTKTGKRRLRIAPTAQILAKHRYPPGVPGLPEVILDPTIPALLLQGKEAKV